jgi:hypothetical protein
MRLDWKATDELGGLMLTVLVHVPVYSYLVSMSRKDDDDDGCFLLMFCAERFEVLCSHSNTHRSAYTGHRALFVDCVWLCSVTTFIAL